MDIVVVPDPANFNRIAQVAVEAHGHVQTGRVIPQHAFSIAAQLSSGERVAIETELGLPDVVQGLDGVPSYDELRSSAIETEIFDVKVAVCSIDDLRLMKRAARRPRDSVDLEDLDTANQ